VTRTLFGRSRSQRAQVGFVGSVLRETGAGKNMAYFTAWWIYRM
jgi:hypothetical protein